jgi:hypothetical protein
MSPKAIKRFALLVLPLFFSLSIVGCGKGENRVIEVPGDASAKSDEDLQREAEAALPQ